MTAAPRPWGGPLLDRRTADEQRCVAAMGRCTPEERTLLLLAPWTVAVGVSGAAPDPGRGEFRVLGTALRRSCRAAGSSTGLVAAVSCALTHRDVPTRDELGFPEVGFGLDPARAAVQACVEIADVLDTRIDRDDATRFRAWLCRLASLVADATSHGRARRCGPLASRPEREAAAEVADALRITRPWPASGRPVRPRAPLAIADGGRPDHPG